MAPAGAQDCLFPVHVRLLRGFLPLDGVESDLVGGQGLGRVRARRRFQCNVLHSPQVKRASSETLTSAWAHSFVKQMRIRFADYESDLIPLPHPSGASPWPRVEPGKSLLRVALRLIARHPALDTVGRRSSF